MLRIWQVDEIDLTDPSVHFVLLSYINVGKGTVQVPSVSKKTPDREKECCLMNYSLWILIIGCTTSIVTFAVENLRDDCSLYLADSSIEGAGLGIYTGVNVQKSELLTKKLGDELCLAIFGDEQTLLSEYAWTASHVGMAYESGKLEETTSFCPGLGMLLNDFVTKDNVELTAPSSDVSIDRQNPLAGSFTYYSNLHVQAIKHIPAGSELYVSYGSSYFTSREAYQSIVPTEQDMSTIFHLSRNLLAFHDKHYREDRGSGDEIIEDILSWFKHEVLPLSFPQNPPLSNLLSSNKQGLMKMISSDESKLQKPLSWLQGNGYCLDRIQARANDKGKGAYAAQPFSKGDIVAPIPLLHLDRRKVYSYAIKKEGENTTTFQNSLMLNYCYSHPESSVLLLPYTSGPNFVNHDLNQPNVKLQWVESKNAKTSFHQPNWLELSALDLIRQPKAGLMMELVAIRNIQPGDEILLNYGELWQKAWDDHLKQWTIPEGANEYIPVNKVTEVTHPILFTKDEQNNYPANLMPACHIKWSRKFSFYEEAIEEGSDSTALFTDVWEERQDTFFGQYNLRPCDILRRQKNNRGNFVYTVQVYNGPSEEDDAMLEAGEKLIVTNVPRRAISFVDRPFTTDQHLSKVFRHPIIIPDKIFPEAWKDRPKQSNSLFKSYDTDEL